MSCFTLWLSRTCTDSRKSYEVSNTKGETSKNDRELKLPNLFTTTAAAYKFHRGQTSEISFYVEGFHSPLSESTDQDV